MAQRNINRLEQSGHQEIHLEACAEIGEFVRAGYMQPWKMSTLRCVDLLRVTQRIYSDGTVEQLKKQIEFDQSRLQSQQELENHEWEDSKNNKEEEVNHISNLEEDLNVSEKNKAAFKEKPLQLLGSKKKQKSGKTRSPIYSQPPPQLET